MTSTKIPLPTHLQSCQDVPGHGGGQLPNIFKGLLRISFQMSFQSWPFLDSYGSFLCCLKLQLHTIFILEPCLHIGSSFDIGIDNGVWSNFSKSLQIKATAHVLSLCQSRSTNLPEGIVLGIVLGWAPIGFLQQSQLHDLSILLWSCLIFSDAHISRNVDRIEQTYSRILPDASCCRMMQGDASPLTYPWISPSKRWEQGDIGLGLWPQKSSKRLTYWNHFLQGRIWI